MYENTLKLNPSISASHPSTNSIVQPGMELLSQGLGLGVPSAEAA